MYPMDEKPVPYPGDFVPAQSGARDGRRGKSRSPTSTPLAGTDKPRRFVGDDRAVANINWVPGTPPPRSRTRGTFHPESAEFWFILLNKIRYNIEGMPVFEADHGGPPTELPPVRRKVDLMRQMKLLGLKTRPPTT